MSRIVRIAELWIQDRREARTAADLRQRQALDVQMMNGEKFYEMVRTFLPLIVQKLFSRPEPMEVANCERCPFEERHDADA